MKKLFITFENQVTLSQGVQQMLEVEINGTYIFLLEEEEVEMLIEELNEMEQDYKIIIENI